MQSSSAGKQHVAAVEAYTRQCMKSRAGAASDDDAGSRGRTVGSGRGSARACYSDEQFAASELMNGRESRPNNLNYGPRQSNDGGSTRRAKMHNEERERRDNRPSSASQVTARGQQPAQMSGRAVDPRLVSPRAVQTAGMQSTVASATKKPVRLNRDDALRLQLNLRDVDEVGSDVWRNNMPHQEQNRNDRSAVSSDYTMSPTPSSNTSYSTDFTRNPAEPSGHWLPSAAAYHRALSELMASSALTQQQTNDVDYQQAKAEPQGSGRGPPRRHSGSEVTTSSHQGRQQTTNNDHLLTAPVVSLSPQDRPDGNHIVARLMEIRDYIQQASAMLETLGDHRDPRSTSHRQQLVSMVDQLRREETDFLKLLHMTLRGDDGEVNGDGTVNDSEADTVTEQDQSYTTEDAADENTEDQDASGSDVISERMKLLQRMHLQQKQLQQLQDRQASLLRLQRESERRLDDRREVTPTNRGDQRLADTPGSAAAAADVGMATETETEDEDVTSAVTESTMSTQDQRHLQDKLRELQMKKQRMDQLLDELQSLKIEREIHNNAVDDEVESESSDGQRLNDSQQATSLAGRTAHEAEEMLKVMEIKHKYKQLNEMRSKLEQLKQLEAAYSEMQLVRDTEPGAQSRPISSVAEAGTKSQSPRSRANEAVSSAAMAHEAAAATADDNVDEVEDESSVPPSPAPPPRPRPPKNYRLMQPDGSESDSMADYNVSTQPDKADIQEKVQELKAAKEKLQRLQELVLRVQQGAGLDALMEIDSVASAAESVDGAATMKREEQEYESEIRRQRDELEELSAERQRLLMMQQHLLKLQESLAAATDAAVQETGGRQELAFHSQARTMARSNLPADGTCATSSAQSSQQKVSPTVPRGSVSSKLRSPVDGGSRPPQSAGGTGTVSTRPAERLPVYGSATSDRRSLPPDGSGSAEQRSSSSTTRPTMSASAAATAAIQVTFQDPIETVMSNEELYDRMRQQRMLREELRDKKKELEDMMRKEHSLKQNSRNQDTQSDVVSYSNKSDAFGASTSEDVTVATWGGSTAGNLESIDEDDDDDDEEDDEDDNEGAAGCQNVLRHIASGRREMRDEDADIDTAVGPSASAAAGGVRNVDDDLLLKAARSRRVARPSPATFLSADADGAVQAHWPIAGSRVVNDVRGRRSRGGGFGNRQENTDESEALNSMQSDIRWIRNRVSSLVDNLTDQRDAAVNTSPAAQGSVAGHQLQQNQLVLSLNQSYFQLVSNQNALIDRFNRLEQMVLGGTSASSNVMMEAYGQHLGPPCDDVVHSTPGYSLFTGAQSPFNLNNCNATRQVSSAVISGDNTSRDVVIETVHARHADTLPNVTNKSAAQGGSTRVDQLSPSSLPGSQDMNQDTAAADSESVASVNASSAFEALRETVYAEVATLISQNESCPHYLIELFRQLQMLSTDFLRQRGLFAIQDIVARYFAKGNEERWRSDGDGTESSRQMVSVSNLTQPKRVAVSSNYSNVASVYQNPSPTRASFVTNAHFDYSEIAVDSNQTSTADNEHLDYPAMAADSSDSMSHSTAGDGACWETPFAQESLGNTVIHFDTIMKKMRDDAIKSPRNAAAGAASAASSHSFSTPTVSTEMNNVVSKQNATSKDESRSSDAAATARQDCVSDRTSDPSVSEASCGESRLDTRELDHEIKEIMLQIIPVVKQQMNSVCTEQVLHYIQQLTTSLTRLQQLQSLPHGSASPRYTEFSRFFHRQLDSILRDSLAKFEGRKMSECGEDLLVDLSEILFNELAFFRLMQNLDTSNTKVKEKLRTFAKNPQLLKADDETSSAADDQRDLDHEHMSTPSPDTSEYNSENELEGSSVAEEENGAPVDDDDDDEDDDDDNDGDGDGDDNDDVDDYDDERDEETDPPNSSRGDSATEHMHQSEQRSVTVDAACTEDGSLSTDNVKRHSYGQHSSSMEIQLAPSETKPFTRIGSDEDDDGDGDEEASVGDPSETAVSRDAAKELTSSSSTSSASSLDHCQDIPGTCFIEAESGPPDDVSAAAVAADEDAAEGAVNNGE